jgi:hypothetical protein
VASWCLTKRNSEDVVALGTRQQQGRRLAGLVPVSKLTAIVPYQGSLGSYPGAWSWWHAFM